MLVEKGKKEKRKKNHINNLKQINKKQSLQTNEKEVNNSRNMSIRIQMSLLKRVLGSCENDKIVSIHILFELF